jgi:hypothetical protein
MTIDEAAENVVATWAPISDETAEAAARILATVEDVAA